MQVSSIEAQTPEREAKIILLDDIDNFIQEKVTFADEQIARIAQSKVDSGDVVLTFAYSSAVLSTFLQAKKVGHDTSIQHALHLVWHLIRVYKWTRSE